MKVLAVVGNSNSGKTRLIAKLIPELKKRGYSVAVIKHCSKGFALSPEGKDSWKFNQAGADAVSMIAPDRLSLIRQDTSQPFPSAVAADYFKESDIVLVEGGRREKRLEKIQVIRKGVAEEMVCPPEEILAVVSDMEVTVDKPVFHPDQVSQIADVVEGRIEDSRSQVSLTIDGSPVRLNPFVQKICTNTLLGMIASLDGIKDNPERITLSLFTKNKPDTNP
jgi:molybdopterin-guanine dinucleotide biosynthesis protein B